MLGRHTFRSHLHAITDFLPANIFPYLLVALTGCQAVGGFDVAKALANSAKTTSSESKQTVTVEVVPAESAKLTAEDQKAIDLMNSFSLNIDSAKVQDTKHISMKGSVGLKGEKIPFLFFMDDKGIALQVEGAKQPLYIPQSIEGVTLPDTSELEAGAQELTVKLAEFVLKHFPNPSVLTVKQTSSQVNGETLSLTNLHAEVRGDELFGLIKPFLASAVKDEQGLRDLIGDYYAQRQRNVEHRRDSNRGSSGYECRCYRRDGNGVDPRANFAQFPGFRSAVQIAQRRP